MEDMKEGIEFAHERGKKVYVTANITAHDGDLEGVEQYFEELKEIQEEQAAKNAQIGNKEQKTEGWSEKSRDL